MCSTSSTGPRACDLRVARRISPHSRWVVVASQPGSVAGSRTLSSWLASCSQTRCPTALVSALLSAWTRQMDQMSGAYRSTRASQACLSPFFARVTRSLPDGSARTVLLLLPIRIPPLSRAIRAPGWVLRAGMPSSSGIPMFFGRGKSQVVLALRMPGADAPAYPRVSGGCRAGHDVRMAPSAMQAHDHVVALGSAALPLDELGAELSAALRGLVPHEAYCLIGFDPISGLRAFQTSRDALRVNMARLVHNETVEHDLHRFTDLASRPSPVGTLGGGGPGGAQSPRLHELLHPQGFSREPRLALRGGRTL